MEGEQQVAALGTTCNDVFVCYLLPLLLSCLLWRYRRGSCPTSLHRFHVYVYARSLGGGRRRTSSKKKTKLNGGKKDSEKKMFTFSAQKNEINYLRRPESVPINVAYPFGIVLKEFIYFAFLVFWLLSIHASAPLSMIQLGVERMREPRRR